MIDQKMIAAHQWIVDESERQPGWWVEQTAWAYIATDITATALKLDSVWDIVAVACTLALGRLMILLSRSPALMASIGASDLSLGVRFTLFALDVYYIVRLFMEPNIERAAFVLSSVLLLSCNYFVACKPPRPRKRRQTVAQGGAA